MKLISQIKYKDLEINFMEENNHIGYSFAYQGRNYGTKVPIELPTTKKKRAKYLEATVALFINAIDSYENLCKESQPSN